MFLRTLFKTQSKRTKKNSWITFSARLLIWTSTKKIWKLTVGSLRNCSSRSLWWFNKILKKKEWNRVRSIISFRNARLPKLLWLSGSERNFQVKIWCMDWTWIKTLLLFNKQKSFWWKLRSKMLLLNRKMKRTFQFWNQLEVERKMVPFRIWILLRK